MGKTFRRKRSIEHDVDTRRLDGLQGSRYPSGTGRHTALIVRQEEVQSAQPEIESLRAD